MSSAVFFDIIVGIYWLLLLVELDVLLAAKACKLMSLALFDVLRIDLCLNPEFLPFISLAHIGSVITGVEREPVAVTLVAHNSVAHGHAEDIERELTLIPSFQGSELFD